MATNLQLIQEFSIAENTTNAIIDNIFSDKYDVYQVLLTNYSNLTDTGGNRTKLRFIDSAGNEESGVNYSYASLKLLASTTFGQSISTSTTLIDHINRVDTGTTSGNVNLTIYNPYSSSSYTFCQWQSNTKSDPSTTLGHKGIGVLKLAESMRGLWIQQVGNYAGTNIKCSVYGVK